MKSYQSKKSRTNTNKQILAPFVQNQKPLFIQWSSPNCCRLKEMFPLQVMIPSNTWATMDMWMFLRIKNSLGPTYFQQNHHPKNTWHFQHHDDDPFWRHKLKDNYSTSSNNFFSVKNRSIAPPISIRKKAKPEKIAGGSCFKWILFRDFFNNCKCLYPPTPADSRGSASEDPWPNTRFRRRQSTAGGVFERS